MLFLTGEERERRRIYFVVYNIVPLLPFYAPFSLKYTCRHIVKNTHQLVTFKTSPLSLEQIGLSSAL
jgi:hypothetical protein